MTKCNGHVCFLGTYEYFRDEHTLYRAPAKAGLDPAGFRLGADWLCSNQFAARFVKSMRQVAAEGRHP